MKEKSKLRLAGAIVRLRAAQGFLERHRELSAELNLGNALDDLTQIAIDEFSVLDLQTLIFESEKNPAS